MLEIIGEILTGQPVDVPTTKAMQWGIDHEDQAVAEYAIAADVFVDRVGWVPLRGEKFIGCSPDGLVGLGGVLEVKCPYTTREHLRTLIHGDVPKQYRAQVQHNIWTTGRAWCDFVSFDPRMPKGLELVTVRVERDSDTHAERVIAFRDEMINRLHFLRERWLEYQANQLDGAVSRGTAEAEGRR